MRDVGLDSGEAERPLRLDTLRLRTFVGGVAVALDVTSMLDLRTSLVGVAAVPAAVVVAALATTRTVPLPLPLARGVTAPLAAADFAFGVDAVAVVTVVFFAAGDGAGEVVEVEAVEARTRVVGVEGVAGVVALPGAPPPPDVLVFTTFRTSTVFFTIFVFFAGVPEASTPTSDMARGEQAATSGADNRRPRVATRGPV